MFWHMNDRLQPSQTINKSRILCITINKHQMTLDIFYFIAHLTQLHQNNFSAIFSWNNNAISSPAPQFKMQLNITFIQWLLWLSETGGCLKRIKQIKSLHLFRLTEARFGWLLKQKSNANLMLMNSNIDFFFSFRHQFMQMICKLLSQSKQYIAFATLPIMLMLQVVGTQHPTTFEW